MIFKVPAHPKENKDKHNTQIDMFDRQKISCFRANNSSCTLMQRIFDLIKNNYKKSFQTDIILCLSQPERFLSLSFFNPLSYEVCLPEEWFLQSSVVWGMFVRGVVLTIHCRMRYVCQRSGSYNSLSYEVCLPEECYFWWDQRLCLRCTKQTHWAWFLKYSSPKRKQRQTQYTDRHVRETENILLQS
jgi:hypothetical protein